MCDASKPCSACGGTGGEYADSYEDGRIVGQYWVKCPHCCGTGEESDE